MLVVLCRKRLFSMINELPTVFEVVTGAAKKQQQKEKSPVSNSSSKSKSNSKPVLLMILDFYVSSFFLHPAQRGKEEEEKTCYLIVINPNSSLSNNPYCFSVLIELYIYPLFASMSNISGLSLRESIL